MRISDIVTIKSEFRPVVDINAINEDNSICMFRNYIVTPYLIKQLFVPLFKLLASSGKNTSELSINMQGVYGTGKTYSLFMIESILRNDNFIKWFIEKINNSEIDENTKSELLLYIESISKKEYLSLYVDMNLYIDIPLRDVIIENMRNKLDFEFNNTRANVALKHIDSLIPEVKNIYEKKLNDTYNIDIDQLKQELIYFKKDGLKKYEQINEFVFGMKFAKLELPMTSLFEELTKDLEKEDKHLVILLDEFTPYLKHKLSDKGKLILLLSQLQEIAQYCNRNSNRVSLICTHHTDLEQYKDILPSNNYSDLNKVMGRFQSITIESFDFQDMLAKVLDIENNLFSQITSQLDNSITQQLDEISELTSIRYSKVYPFHPYTVYLLPFISSRIGQEQRTNFMFIQESYKKFAQKNAINKDKLTLILPNELFDYFEDVIKNRRDIYEAYLQSWEYAKNFSKGEKVIKTLFILYLAAEYKLGTNEQYKYVENGLPLKRLALVLHEPINEIHNILQNLIKSNYVFYNDLTGKYSFVAAKRFNPNRIEMEIEQESNKLKESIDEQDILREVRRQLGFPKTMYIANPLERFFLYEICFEHQVQEQIKQLDINASSEFLGKVMYIIPSYNKTSTDTKVLEDVFSSEDYKMKANRIVLVKLVNQHFNYFDYIKTIIIRKKTQSISNDEYTQNFMKQKLKMLEEKFRIGLSTSFYESNLKYYWNKNVINISLDALLKKIDCAIYNQFPEVSIDLFRKASATKLIKHFISQGKYEGKSSELIKLIDQFLNPLGLAKSNLSEGQYSAFLCEPTSHFMKSYYIWSYLIQYFSTEKENANPISYAFNKFTNEPYGLSEEIIALYIFVLIKLGKINIINKVSKLNVNDFNESIFKEFIRYKDGMFAIKELYDNNVIEYTKLANELAGKREVYRNMTAIEATDEIYKYTSIFYTTGLKLSRKLKEIGISSPFVSNIINKIFELNELKPMPAEFLKKYGEIINQLNTTYQLNFKDVINLFSDIDQVYFKILICKSLMEKLSFYTGEKPDIKTLFDNFSLNIYKRINLIKLIEGINELIDLYIERYNEEHTILNKYRNETLDKWKNSKEYALLLLFLDEAEVNYFNQFHYCRFKLSEDNILMSYDRCKLCNYTFGSIDAEKDKIDQILKENLIIAKYKIDEYISNGISYLTDIQKYNDNKLQELRNIIDNDKHSAINQIKSVIKNTRLVKLNNTMNINQKFIIKLDSLVETIKKSEIKDKANLISIIINWVNNNL